MERCPGIYDAWIDERDDAHWLRRRRKRQCEAWHKVTPFIAEFYCTISNLPFLLVAAMFGYWPLAVVGTVSFFHHAIPLWCLWRLDTILAPLFMAWVASHRACWSGQVFGHGLAVLVTFFLDGRARALGPRRVWYHVQWHLVAASFMITFLGATSAR